MTGVDAITAEHVDEVLATTRAVRRRLDLDRPVDNQLLLDWRKRRQRGSGARRNVGTER